MTDPETLSAHHQHRHHQYCLHLMLPTLYTALMGLGVTRGGGDGDGARETECSSPTPTPTPKPPSALPVSDAADCLDCSDASSDPHRYRQRHESIRQHCLRLMLPTLSTALMALRVASSGGDGDGAREAECSSPTPTPTRKPSHRQHCLRLMVPTLSTALMGLRVASRAAVMEPERLSAPHRRRQRHESQDTVSTACV